MIRSTARFKQYAALGFVSLALVSAACSDEEDRPSGSAGGGGSSAGKASGGTNASGSPTGGKASAGTSGMPSAGTQSAAGSEGEGGSPPEGGATNQGGAPDAVGGSGDGGVGMGGEDGAAGASAGAGGGGGEGGEPFVADVLDNPGWETGTPHGETMPGWTNEGTPGAAYIEYSSPHTGFGRLGHWTMWVDAESPPYTARTFQTLDPIANGTYSFSVWVDRGYAEEQYLFARDFNADDANAEMTQVTSEAEAASGYFKITLSGIQVTSGKCTVGIYTANPAGTYANFDDAEFTPE